ncbi:hypothetical protein F4778DRAFT_793454 [Xylariomycetidae sp. FL2044]|nr:hypothetical protein F4778DRAFT_793454 [Xylariomycetidae sp. FL2044]
MHSSLKYVAALASLAAALPGPAPADPWAGVIDPWGQYGTKPHKVKRAPIQISPDGNTDSHHIIIGTESFHSDEFIDHAKRATVENFAGGSIPGCDKTDNPSNTDVPKPKWKVNEGVKIPKSGKDDRCTTGHNGDHCWTEYYLVEAAVEYFDWKKTGNQINCPDGNKDTCSVAVTDLKQDCTTTGTTHTEGEETVFSGSLSLGLEGGTGTKVNGGIGLGGGHTWNWADTDHNLVQSCHQDSTTATCVWNNDSSDRDDLCHQVWFAERVLHVWGQAQRVCNKCTNGAVQQNSGDGKVCVRGQKEFNFKQPLNKLVHCNGKCGSEDPGITQPSNEPRASYVAPDNWATVVVGPIQTGDPQK